MRQPTAPQLSARERFIAFRRSVGAAPPLVRQTVEVRGLPFAVFTTQPTHERLPMVCVNGGLIYAHQLLWPALSPLSRNRQLIFYDQRGRGHTPAPPGAEGARIEHDAGDLTAVRTALGLSRWDVLGHSWGGGIAMLGAAADREGVRKLVLVDSVGITSKWLAQIHDSALERLAPPQRALLHRLDPLSLHNPDASVHSAYSRAIYPAWFADAELSQLLAAPRSESRTGAAVAARLRREGYDWTSLVRAVHAATLVIHGSRDLLPLSVAREIVAHIPHAELAMMESSGHMPFWEQPGDFFATVENFLQR
ncbi:MAG: alpha/beta fold hydrolase [Gemmatimonadota bacterium]